jgi:hypothetical protein
MALTDIACSGAGEHVGNTILHIGRIRHPLPTIRRILRPDRITACPETKETILNAGRIALQARLRFPDALLEREPAHEEHSVYLGRLPVVGNRLEVEVPESLIHADVAESNVTADIRHRYKFQFGRCAARVTR